MVSKNSSKTSARIAVLLHDLRGGGAERVVLHLVRGLIAAGREVDLVLVRAEGKYLKDIPAGARVVNFDRSNVYKAVPDLVRYLKRERPAAVLAALTHVNLMALIARFLSGVRTRVVVCEHNQMTYKIAAETSPRGRLIYAAVPLFYRAADAVVAVSNGVADDIAKVAKLPRERVLCVYNPVYDESLSRAAAQPVDHPWLVDRQAPVLIAAGRLHPQKGFDVLLRTMRKLKARTPCRLIIMGEGEERPALEALARELGVTEDVSLIGFVENPYAMMAKADAFVLSSRWEGLPTVLVEALATGVPVVSTNCPSGPDEILEDGKYGVLTPVEDPDALAEGVELALKSPRDVGKARALDFSIEASTQAYIRVLDAT